MKTLLTILLSITYLTTLAQADNLITERIIYTVRSDDKSGSEQGLYNHLDSLSKVNFINQICDLIYNRELKAACYWGDKIGALPDYYNTLSDHLLESRFAWNDTMKYRPYSGKRKKNIDIPRDNRVYRYLINSLSFQEQWYFDKNKNIFSKNVTGIILFQDQYTHNTGANCNYYIALNDTTQNEYNPEYLLAKNIIYDVPVSRSELERYDETNWWHDYLEASKRERFFDIVTDKALYDTIMPFQAFKPTFPYDSLIQRSQQAHNELSALYYGRSDWYTSDPLMFGMTEEKIKACCFELSDWRTIKKVRFNEEWYFDPIKFRFEKKIWGIGLIVDTFNDEGNITGEKCIVYYKLNNN